MKYFENKLFKTKNYRRKGFSKNDNDSDIINTNRVLLLNYIVRKYKFVKQEENWKNGWQIEHLAVKIWESEN
jgi:ribosome-binding protein aMBF1 (putative translation factor)